jgi:hypothetical protein
MDCVQMSVGIMRELTERLEDVGVDHLRVPCAADGAHDRDDMRDEAKSFFD